MDTIKLMLQAESDHLESYLEINSVRIQHYTDPFSFLFYWRETTNRQYDEYYKMVAKDESEFYPFTCSCGIAGCASIWNGILVKWRKHTVEWRLANRSEDGYTNILDKSFYSFDRKEYENVAKELVRFCEANPELEYEHNCYTGETLQYFKENYGKQYEEIVECTH